VRRELRALGPNSAMSETVEAWPGAVGPEIARNAWPARFQRDGTLVVHASSAAWAFELGHLERDILGRLRERLGDAAPPRLRFAPGRLPEASAETTGASAAAPVEPSLEDRVEAERLAEPIESENLRKVVARAAAASLAKAAAGRSV
jgi:hypothetical protein